MNNENSPYNACITCKNPFTNDNVFTSAGWRETQITGMCEKWFDKIFEGMDDE